MKIIFLGTGSMQPTKTRNLSSIYISHDKDNFLVDCGDGTQRQMKIADLKPTKITKILISHFHADHILGLGGIVRSLYANQYNGTIEIYGPKNLKKFFENIINSAFYSKGLKIKLIEFEEGKIIETNSLIVEAVKLSHSVPSFGFIFKEKDKRKINLDYTSKFGLTKHPLLGNLQNGKDIIYNNKKIKVEKATKLVKGKKLGIITDTEPCSGCLKIAKDSDLLISESTFSESDLDKAKEYKHMTSKQAATIAKKAKCKKLILTHFSQRYKDVKELKREAELIFSNTETAEDFKSFQI